MEYPTEPTAIPATVEYATPERELDAYHPLPAILLCAPGMLCWVLLLSIVSGIVPRMFVMLGDQLFLPLVAAAVITAIWSIIYYRFVTRRRKPWFVTLNLVINITGLVLLVLLFFVGIVIAIQYSK